MLVTKARPVIGPVFARRSPDVPALSVPPCRRPPAPRHFKRGSDELDYAYAARSDWPVTRAGASLTVQSATALAEKRPPHWQGR